ncbi:diguanylate cyclase [Sphingomonas sp. SUN019]|uniref:sensor domain-containing diguanylate cyclase n=1 Tax=Sphingomonas sp. SUN019 TaxID=2937788 RepID=UPI00216499D5|nr:diguanylate cyclase [Sphingomonas sp. SUN019]UVO49832.1 diguanylate cyclase [Sphingomonas sp. SUN019]
MARRRYNRVAEAIALGTVYFAAAAVTIAGTRFDGGVAFLWIATAVLTARLVTQKTSRWPASIAACFIAGAAATTLFGFGATAALPLAVVNVAEAVLGAALLRRLSGGRTVNDTHHWLIAFVVSAGMAGPLAGAIGAGATIHLLYGRAFLPEALHWYSGHALGTLAFMPIAVMILRGEAARLLRNTRRAKLVELAMLLTLVALVSLITFAQDRMPLLFLPMLPIVLATFRGGALSTAASIVVVSLIGGAFTLNGHGPIALMDGDVGSRIQFLQFFIAATMLTVLPANAELQRRAELFRRLRESEARYRMVTDNTTDIIINIDIHGRLRFVSSSIREIGGHDPDALVGRHVSVLVDATEVDKMREMIAATVDDPMRVTVSEYRAPTRSGERWFESRTRAVLDDDGVVTGLVSAVRDVTHRKEHEDSLARAALTDPLTGLANRIAFRTELTRQVATGTGGCVAVFDLDHFKLVNDRHGHAAGDEVLRRFAAIARAAVRDQDMVARLGGEEFAVVLPDASIEQARLVCDRLRAAVGATRCSVDSGTIAVTVSGGVASYRAGDADDAVLHAADTALYRAKDAGRDRLALAA